MTDIEIKPGQKWIFTKASINGYFTKGKQYEVLAFYPDSAEVRIKDNNGVRSNGGKGHIWHATKTGFYGSFKPAFEVPVDIKAHIADTAKSIVSGARRSAYGTPEQNFERIAALWSGYATARGWGITFTAADVSPLMILMKLARLAETPDHLDSAIDGVGYFLTLAEVNGIKKDA